MKRAAALSLAAVLLAACQSAAPLSTEHPLVSTNWRVQEIDGRRVLDHPPSTLSLESRERVTGQAGCNRFFGRADLDAGRLVIGEVGSTKMACATSVMDQEQRFLRALQAVAYWEREGDVLRLLDSARTVRVRLTR